VAFKTSSE